MYRTIAPQVPTTVDMYLNNPSDTGAYFVRAVIKDKNSGTTLATLNLTDNGGQYFSKSWTTPVDSLGQGREILVIKTVYSDSGYSSVSPIYGAEYETWLVQTRTQFFGGGGGEPIDYQKLRDVIREVSTETEKTEPDLSAILAAVSGSNKPILKRIQERLEKLLSLETREMDLERMEKAMAAYARAMRGIAETHAENMRTAAVALEARLVSVFETAKDELSESIEDLKADSAQQLAEEVRGLGDTVIATAKKEFGKLIGQPLEVRMLGTGEIVRRGADAEPPARPLSKLLS